MGYIDEEGRWQRFGSSPVKDSYIKLVRMNGCKKCGKEHGMVIEDKVTGKCEPLDLCYQCIFGDWKPAPIEQIKLEDLDENSSFKEWGEALRKVQDQIIRDMIISSAVPSQIPEDGSM